MPDDVVAQAIRPDEMNARLDVLTVPRQIDDLLTRVHDERHRAILRNYRRHVLLELAGRWPEILSPRMTVAHPVYRSVMGAQTTVYDGAEEVAGFYQGMVAAGMTVSAPIEERVAVADWGLAVDSLSLSILPGHVLAAQGFPVADPHGVYRFTLRLAMIWPYDEQVRLIGENVYVDLSPVRIVPADPADIVTPERAAELVTPLLDETP
jgi:hypothetical protein